MCGEDRSQIEKMKKTSEFVILYSLGDVFETQSDNDGPKKTGVKVWIADLNLNDSNETYLVRWNHGRDDRWVNEAWLKSCKRLYDEKIPNTNWFLGTVVELTVPLPDTSFDTGQRFTIENVEVGITEWETRYTLVTDKEARAYLHSGSVHAYFKVVQEPGERETKSNMPVGDQRPLLPDTAGDQ